MDMDKNLLLVKMVQKFPCLYKSDSIEYSSRVCTEKAWREVSKEIKISVIECKEKWKNLRYGLLRSLRPTRDGSAKKKYYLHDEMEFLIPYVGTSTKTKKRIANYTEVEELEEFKNEHEGTYENDIDRFDISHDVESNSVIDEDPLRKRVRKDYGEHEKSSNKFEDSRRMFLLSLLPEIADFSENQMKMFRRKIFGLLDEINDMEINFSIIKSEPL